MVRNGLLVCSRMAGVGHAGVWTGQEGWSEEGGKNRAWRAPPPPFLQILLIQTCLSTESVVTEEGLEEASLQQKHNIPNWPLGGQLPPTRPCPALYPSVCVP